MERHGGSLNACHYVEAADLTDYTLCDSDYRTFWERYDYGDSKTIRGYQGLRGKRNEQMPHRAFSGP